MTTESPPTKPADATAPFGTPDPKVTVDLMLTQVALTRAQLGLGPATVQQRPTLRDVSPFGR
jgi:hypothetical protein